MALMCMLIRLTVPEQMCYHGNTKPAIHNRGAHVPRNPSKARCAVPGCRAWAMRGHTHCRTHRDRELGPRHGGGQRGNLNALSHAGYSDGLPEPDLDRLAAAADAGGEDLAFQLGLAVRAIQGRTNDPFLTLLALDRVLDGLVDRVAAQLLHRELSEALAPIPPQERESIQANIERLAARDGPRQALITFRRLRKAHQKKTDPIENEYRNGD